MNENFSVKMQEFLPIHQRNMQSNVIIMECCILSPNYFQTLFINWLFPSVDRIRSSTCLNETFVSPGVHRTLFQFSPVQSISFFDIASSGAFRLSHNLFPFFVIVKDHLASSVRMCFKREHVFFTFSSTCKSLSRRTGNTRTIQTKHMYVTHIHLLHIIFRPKRFSYSLPLVYLRC